MERELEDADPVAADRSLAKWRGTIKSKVTAAVLHERRRIMGAVPPSQDLVRHIVARGGDPDEALQVKLSARYSGRLHTAFGVPAYIRGCDRPEVVAALGGSLVQARRSSRLATRLRCGSHFLRSCPAYSGPRRDLPDTCPLCATNAVETVPHFLVHCPALEPTRQSVLAGCGVGPPCRRAAVEAVLRAVTSPDERVELLLDLGGPLGAAPLALAGFKADFEVYARRLLLGLASSRMRLLSAAAAAPLAGRQPVAPVAPASAGVP